MPLVLPVHVICNTSDDRINANIRENSRNVPASRWIEHTEPHGQTAVMCGSGPCLADSISAIRHHRASGHVIFAMNGAAKYLNDEGIYPDFQVIIDARPETAALVGPAISHLFASQVHPDCFKAEPGAFLWHLQIEGIDDLLPPNAPEMLSLVGGAASVGNTAMCLGYVMGYRNFHCYGYDSSHRDGAGHAFHQPLNDGDPCCWVAFGGKDYLCSLTMKLQAEKFQTTARALKDLGCTIEVHGDGLLPAIYRTPQEVLDEQEKYRRMWEIEEYKQFSPGERAVDTFIDKAKPAGLVVDFGCGSGKASLAMAKHGLRPFMIDFVSNSRVKDAEYLPFMKWDLKEPLTVQSAYGFCADVMEHIAPGDVELVIRNIMNAAKKVFFQICLLQENFGVLIGQYLHLTVRPAQWWHDLIEGMGYTIEWEDHCYEYARFVVRNSKEQT